MSAAEDNFYLSAEPEQATLELEAEPFAPSPESESAQVELFLPTENPEAPPRTPQRSLIGLAPPRYQVELSDGRILHFQHAHSLLESLEVQDVNMHYQCREGYCGSCRVQLLAGEVHYTTEPMAWLNDNEILTCCAIPKTNLKIKL